MHNTNPSFTKAEAEYWAAQLRKKRPNVTVHHRCDTCPCKYHPDGTWDPRMVYEGEYCVTYKDRQNWIHWYPSEQVQRLLSATLVEA